MNIGFLEYPEQEIQSEKVEIGSVVRPRSLRRFTGQAYQKCGVMLSDLAPAAREQLGGRKEDVRRFATPLGDKDFSSNI